MDNTKCQGLNWSLSESLRIILGIHPFFSLTPCIPCVCLFLCLDFRDREREDNSHGFLFSLFKSELSSSWIMDFIHEFLFLFQVALVIKTLVNTHEAISMFWTFLSRSFKILFMLIWNIHASFHWIKMRQRMFFSFPSLPVIILLPVIMLLIDIVHVVSLVAYFLSLPHSNVAWYNAYNLNCFFQFSCCVPSPISLLSLADVFVIEKKKFSLPFKMFDTVNFLSTCLTIRLIQKI